MKPVAFDYRAATSSEDALSALTRSDGVTKILSGGQSLGPMLNLRLVRPDLVVDIRRAGDLTAVREEAGRTVYGAATPHALVEDGLVPDNTVGMMRHVAGGMAYRAVRARGTMGGSLAHADPAADWVTTLTALDATLTLAGPTGTRTVPMTRFMVGAFATVLAEGELITEISVPTLSASAAWGYFKICRKKGEFAEAIGALVVDPDRAYCRLVMGAADGPPVLLEDIADRLAAEGSTALSGLRDAVRAALPGATPVSLRQHEVALRRAIEQVYPQ